MRQPILDYIKDHPLESATQIAEGLQKKPSSVASCLTTMTREGLVVRKEGCGPRGGYGYEHPIRGGETTWYERLDSTLEANNVPDM